MTAGNRRLFALDECFPQNIVKVLRDSIPEAELVCIDEIDPHLRNTEDWKILVQLFQDSRPWDGLITNDMGMLQLPKEVAVLCQTKLTLVVAESAGDDPVLATGLVLTHLPHICKETSRDRAQVWRLRTTRRPAEDPWKYLREIAEREKQSAKSLYKRHSIVDLTGRKEDH